MAKNPQTDKGKPDSAKIGTEEEKLSTDNLLKAYRISVARKIAAGEKGLASELEYLKQIDKENTPVKEDNDADTKTTCTPLSYSIKRPYTVTDAVRKRNSKAGKISAKKFPNKNWRHGKWAKSAITALRPCLSTCETFPCMLVDAGKVQPGSVCLDLTNTVDAFQDILAAIKEDKYDNYIEMVAWDQSELRDLYRRSIQILRDNELQLEPRVDAAGKTIGHAFKLNPLFPEIQKLADKLGLSPSENMMTPLQKTKQKAIKEGFQTVAEYLSHVGSTKKTQAPEDEDEDE